MPRLIEKGRGWGGSDVRKRWRGGEGEWGATFSIKIGISGIIILYHLALIKEYRIKTSGAACKVYQNNTQKLQEYTDIFHGKLWGGRKVS